MPLADLDIETVALAEAPAAASLLVAFAHPDDESFGIPGTIADAARRGVAVHLICATRGERGERPSSMSPDADLGALRTQELLAAARALGIRAVHFLPYQDSGMAGDPSDHPAALVRAPIERVTEQVTAIIRAVRPDGIVTFGAYGGYGHPDHIAIHRATLAAFDTAGDPARFPDQLAADVAPSAPRLLYTTTFGTTWLRTVTRALRLIGRDPRRFGANADIDLLAAIDGATPETTVLDTFAVHAQKEAAWVCHASQRGTLGPLFLLPSPLRRRLMRHESFTRVVPAWPAGAPVERDLVAALLAARKRVV